MNKPCRKNDISFDVICTRENSGGLIADMAIDDFDLARWRMGSEVIRTTSEGDGLVFPESVVGE
jgi:predicted dehydrogenase